MVIPTLVNRVAMQSAPIPRSGEYPAGYFCSGVLDRQYDIVSILTIPHKHRWLTHEYIPEAHYTNKER